MTWESEGFDSWTYSTYLQRYAAQLASYGGTVAVAYKKETGAGQPPLLLVRTLTNGSWDSDQNVDGDGLAMQGTTANANEQLCANVAYNSTGTLYIAYPCKDGDSIPAIAVRSRPAGGSWSAPAFIYEPFDEGIDFPQLFIDAEDNVHLVFAVTISFYNRQFGIGYTRLTNGVWGSPTYLNYSGDWIPAHGGAGMTVLPDGEVIVAWTEAMESLVIASLKDGSWTVSTFAFMPNVYGGPFYTPAVTQVGGYPVIIFNGYHAEGENTLYGTIRNDDGWAAPYEVANITEGADETCVHPAAIPAEDCVVFSHAYWLGSQSWGQHFGSIKYTLAAPPKPPVPILPIKARHIWCGSFGRNIFRNAR